MRFHPLASHRFEVGGEIWHAGVLSAEPNGRPERFAAVMRQGDNPQLYALKPLSYDGKMLTDVTLFSHPKQDAFRLDTLPTALCEHLADALEVAVRQEGKKVDPELPDAIRKGGNLKAEREAQPIVRQLTRGADYDLEAAHALRDSLRAELDTALDEGREQDARVVMERLAAVGKDIAAYETPGHLRGVTLNTLGPREEAQVQAVEKTTATALTREAVDEAIAHFEKEVLRAEQRGDAQASEEAVAKVHAYDAARQSLKKALEQETTGKSRRPGAPSSEAGGYMERILQERGKREDGVPPPPF